MFLGLVNFNFHLDIATLSVQSSYTTKKIDFGVEGHHADAEISLKAAPGKVSENLIIFEQSFYGF